MTIGCPRGLSQARQIRLLRRAQEATAASGCPIAIEQAAQIHSLPQSRAQQGEESSKAMRPLTEEGTETQQQINQQSGPHLPPHGVGVVPEKVGQLERLPEFFEKHFDAPAAAIQIPNRLSTPGHVVG